MQKKPPFAPLSTAQDKNYVSLKYKLCEPPYYPFVDISILSPEKTPDPFYSQEYKYL